MSGSVSPRTRSVLYKKYKIKEIILPYLEENQVSLFDIEYVFEDNENILRIYIDNEVRVASLFIKVPQDEFDAKVVDMYIRAAKQYGDVPLTVANDGDVTALAGSMSLKSGQVLGRRYYRTYQG